MKHVSHSGDRQMENSLFVHHNNTELQELLEVKRKYEVKYFELHPKYKTFYSKKSHLKVGE